MDVQANNTTLYVEQAGSGPSVIFVHGMCGDARVWADQVERLSSRFQCTTYDRRGHTRSPRTEATETVQLHADDLAALITRLNLAPTIVVGSSGGARVTLDLIRRLSHLVAGAVMSEPPVGALAPELFATMIGEVAPAVEDAAQAGNPRAAVDAFFSAICPGLWAHIDEVTKDRYRDNAPMLFADLGMPAYQITTDDLAEIHVPTLVIAGTKSHPALHSAAHNLSQALPDARYLELDCGHVTYAEQPSEFARAVSAFATEVAGRTTVGGVTAVTTTTGLYHEVRGSGPAVLLIPGATGDAGHFARAAAVLADDFTVITYDRRGNSRSATNADSPAAATMAAQADDAAALIRECGFDEAVVFGTSGGATIALELLRRDPAAVRGALIHEPPLVGLLPPQDGPDPIEPIIQLARTDPGAALAAFVKLNSSDAAWEALDEATRERMIGNAVNLFERELGEFLAYLPDPATLRNLTVPAVPLRSSQGLPFAEPIHEWLQTHLGTPGAIITGHHAPYLDSPEAFAEELRPLLKSLWS